MLAESTHLDYSFPPQWGQKDRPVSIFVDHLASRGILEEWDTLGRGDVYRVNVDKLQELAREDEVVR